MSPRGLRGAFATVVDEFGVRRREDVLGLRFVASMSQPGHPSVSLEEETRRQRLETISKFWAHKHRGTWPSSGRAPRQLYDSSTSPEPKCLIVATTAKDKAALAAVMVTSALSYHVYTQSWDPCGNGGFHWGLKRSLR